MMRIAVIQFPGSNCERETMLAIKRAGMEAVEFLWNEDIDKLRACQGYVIVGGFSYEDRSRAGIIAALDPIMAELKIQSDMGKPILGICNGAQILVETGLVPGLENNKVAVSLTENKRMQNGKLLGTGYYNAWVHLKLAPNYQRNAFTRYLTPNSMLHVPIAHAEGRFIMPDALLTEIKEQGLDVLHYCDQAGNEDEHFPVNPNGSIGNIAALSNKAGNILAIMPHPERTLEGDALFKSMRDYISEGSYDKVLPLNYYPRVHPPKPYQKETTAQEYLVRLIITDNHAKTVQATLNAHGFQVQVERYLHWEITCDNEQVLQAILKSGVLYNDRKEKLISAPMQQDASIACYLVRPKEDMQAKAALQMLINHYQIKGNYALRAGIIWKFSHEFATMADIIHPILKTNIIHNPYAHDCYQYSS